MLKKFILLFGYVTSTHILRKQYVNYLHNQIFRFMDNLSPVIMNLIFAAPSLKEQYQPSNDDHVSIQQ